MFRDKFGRGASVDAEIRDLAGDHGRIIQLGDADAEIESLFDQVDESVFRDDFQ
ncbi:hypothetical protein D3C87_2197890 [compost metagenome]